MKSPVKVAMIGAGWWANEALLPALRANSQAEIAVVHSRDLEKARRSAERFGCKHWTASVEAALQTPGLQAVIIASTPNVHHEQVLAALRCGLHVLVEKPLALNFSDAMALHEEAARRGLHVVVSCPWQFTAHATELRRRLALESTGPLRSAHILMTNWVRHLTDPAYSEEFPTHLKFTEKPNANSYSDPAISGGGFSFSQLSHALAWLFHVTDDAPVGVSAQLETAGAPVDIFASVLIRLKKGGIVTLAGVGNPPPSHRAFEVRLFCENAAADLELWKGRAEWMPHTGDREPWPTLERAEIYPLAAPVNALVDLVCGGGENNSPLSPSVKAVQVIEAALQSAKTGGSWIKISSHHEPANNDIIRKLERFLTQP